MLKKYNEISHRAWAVSLDGPCRCHFDQESQVLAQTKGLDLGRGYRQNFPQELHMHIEVLPFMSQAEIIQHWTRDFDCVQFVPLHK